MTKMLKNHNNNQDNICTAEYNETALTTNSHIINIIYIKCKIYWIMFHLHHTLTIHCLTTEVVVAPA